MSRKTYRRRLSARPAPKAPDTGYIDTINALARQARTSWLTLLTFLAFIGVTLLAVEDIDFFVPSRQTDLPLIGISIPTNRFFWVAPLLAAALYAQLHFLLLKLWEATAPSRAPNEDPDSPLSDKTNASFITDLALAARQDNALRKRPLALLTRWVTGLLIFAATPVILGLFWWRSMPAQNPYLTLIGCGLPFFFATYIALRSYIRMRRLQSSRPEFSGCWTLARWSAAATLLTVIIGLGTFRTYISLPAFLADLTLPNGSTRYSYDRDEFWWRFIPHLASADLRAEDLVEAPDILSDYTTMYRDFRTEWCQSRNLSLFACGNSPFSGPVGYSDAHRHDWCNETLRNLDLDLECRELWETVEDGISSDWFSKAFELRDQLPLLDLSNTSLRGADLTFAQLQGAVLFGANLENANLEAANLWGANISGSNLSGAKLWATHLTGAYISNVDLHNVDFWNATIEYASLSEIELIGGDFSGALASHSWWQEVTLTDTDFRGADLRNSHFYESSLQLSNFDRAFMEGAIFRAADLRGSSFIGVRSNRYTSFHGADLMGSAIRDLRSLPLALSIEPDSIDDEINPFYSHIGSVFGDGSVVLPDETERPDHWARVPDDPLGRLHRPGDVPLDDEEFQRQWRAWQATLPEGWEN